MKIYGEKIREGYATTLQPHPNTIIDNHYDKP